MRDTLHGSDGRQTYTSYRPRKRAVSATLLAVGILAQVLAEGVQRPRKEVASMRETLRVVGSSLMVTVSAVSISTATASSNPVGIRA